MNHSKELALKSILERLTQSDSEGLVVAGADYVIRAGLAQELMRHLSEQHRKLFEASSGSEPLTEIV